MLPTLKIHPRICDTCEKSAEKPYVALWNHHINERVSLCSKICFDIYKQTIITISIYEKANVPERRKSV